MRIIKPSYEILTPINGEEILKIIENIARTCYKSQDNIKEGSASKLVSNLIKNGHEAMLEFFDIIIRFICDKGISHELVRHRTGNYAQESTRYVNYSQDKFNNEITVIEPLFFNFNSALEVKKYNSWCSACEYAEKQYLELLKNGATPQEARSVLPNSIKTEINVKNDLRNWRHFLKLRTNKSAHPQMRELTIPLLKELKGKIPIIFDDI